MGLMRVGVGGLQAGVLLEAVPDAVVRVDGVVDLEDDQVLAVAVVQRLGALVGAAGAVEQVGRGSACRVAARRWRRAGQESTGVGVPAVLL